MPQTVAERSRYQATSTHAEVMAFLQELEGHPWLHLTDFGVSPGGRRLPLAVLSTAGVRTPAEARGLGRPVVLLQNCIHAGEVEGKEAVLALMRDILNGKDTDILDKLTVVVVPIFNPDGNDAMDTANRALDIARLTGQDGPPKVGTRVNAKGINLNRDYIRHDAEEMRLLQTRVCHPWEPELSVDTHATNGSVHRFDMTVDIPHTVESGRREPIEYMRSVVVPGVSAAVKANYGLESGWYGNFVEDERVLDAGGTADPGSAVGEGWMTYPHHPRFGGNYRGLTGRCDLLMECYSYLDYEARVRTSYAWLHETLRLAAARADELQGLVAAGRTPPARVAVRYGLEPFSEPVEILTREPRTRQGAPGRVRIPHIARFVGTCVVDRPRAYVLPGHLAAFLRGHGLNPQPAPAAATVEVARFLGADREPGRAILEAGGVGHRRVAWRSETRSLPADAVLVHTDQPLGAVAVYLAEPESDDGLVENGHLPTPPVGGDFEVLRWVE